MIKSNTLTLNYYFGTSLFFYLIAQMQHNTPFNSLFTSMEATFSIASAHVFWIAFHTLFSIKLLNIKEYYPRLSKYLLYTGYFLLGLSFFGIYNLEIAIQIIHPFMIILPFVLLFTAIILHIKKNRLAIFYIIAQTLFLTSSLIFGLLFAGVLEYNNFTRYIHLLGSFSEIILFSFALAYKTNLIMQENEKQKEMITDYSKLSFLGQTFINIYHQWKTPVNNIFNSINHIEVAKEFNDKNLVNIIDSNINQIKLNTNYIKETASNYLQYYKSNDKKDDLFNIYEEINSVVNFVKSDIKKSDLKIEINCSEKIYFKANKSYFDNLLMTLFENSINISKKRNIKNLKIKIEVFLNSDSIKIIFKDSAGGIEYKPINEIFEKNISLSNSTGIGLYMAKYFLMEKLRGTIEAKNSKNGAIFEINLSTLAK